MKPLARIFFALIVLISTSLSASAKDLQTAVFAGGCFWCVEADYDMVEGVVETVSGFTGGTVANPSYKQVTRGGTGHYEAVQITFDADVVSFDTLVDIFWRTVDPTDAGGQFCDRGNSYKTAIFAVGDAQTKSAAASKEVAARALGRSIVTPIIAAGEFYPAEDYHQNYYMSKKKILTRYGRITKKDAYKRYRKSCGRDARVKDLWGKRAFVVAGS